MIKIQEKNFDIEKEVNDIKCLHKNVGAVSNFIGYVRNTNNNKKVNSIEIEVYRDMALKSLNTICKKASEKWNLLDFLVIHRFGKLEVNEKIVLVSTFSMHRQDSDEACNYIMNFLKKDAPFWKKEFYNKEVKWL